VSSDLSTPEVMSRFTQHSPPYLLIAHTIIVIVFITGISNSILIKIFLPRIGQLGAVVL
jgi:hypothetical protein